MRRIAVMLILAALAGPAHAERPRELIGQLWTPAADRGNAEYLAICVFASGQQPEFDGWTGRVEVLEPADRGRAFRLYDAEMGLSPPPSDFDISFYDQVGDCQMPGLPLWVHDGPGNESGTVPTDANYAVVTVSDDVIVPYVLEIAR